MRILFDDEVFFRQRFGGVSRIFAKLIEGIEQNSNHQLLFNCNYSENEYLLQLKPNINSFLKPYQFPLKGKLIRGIYGRYSHQKTINTIGKNKANVFHPTFYANYYLQALNKAQLPLVFTVHDLIHEQTPNNAHYAQMAKMKEENLEPPTPKLGPIAQWRYECCQKEAAQAPTQFGVTTGLRLCREKFGQ